MKKSNGILNKIRKSSIIAVLTAIMLFCLIFCLILGDGYLLLNNSAQALTTANINNAILAGDGAEMWNGSSFNSKVVNDLYDKLFGKEDPVDYIKANGTEDYTSKGSKSPSPEASIPYFVIPASTINTKVGNASYGMVVQLDGKFWMVTSLTLADIGDEKDNVVMTLMLADSLGTSQFSTNGIDAYSASSIRNHLLTNSNWSLFNETGTNGFASKFLVQPKNIQYQHTESWLTRGTNYTNFTFSNEALGQITSWNTSPYQPGNKYGGVLYEAWGEDYIWLPSASETGVE